MKIFRHRHHLDQVRTILLASGLSPGFENLAMVHVRAKKWLILAQFRISNFRLSNEKKNVMASLEISIINIIMHGLPTFLSISGQERWHSQPTPTCLTWISSGYKYKV